MTADVFSERLILISYLLFPLKKLPDDFYRIAVFDCFLNIASYR